MVTDASASSSREESDLTASVEDVQVGTHENANKHLSPPSQGLRSKAFEVAQATIDAGQFEDAVQACTLALRESAAATDAPHKKKMLLMRAAAYNGLARRLTSIPAAESERHALFGLDPTQLATMALKDTEAAAAMDAGGEEAGVVSEPWLQRARALQLLERYQEAREAFYEGLALEPARPELQAGVREVEALLPDAPAPHDPARRRTVPRESGDDLECVLCMKLFFEPVTTSCGHTFCRSCLARALDHKNKCPMCRTVIMIKPDSHPVTLVLEKLLLKHFPEEYAERRNELSQNVHQASGLLPLFVMDIVLPGQRVPLNIFEPRYRLMMRRCMDGNRRFGMV